MLITQIDPAERAWIESFGSGAIEKLVPPHMGGADGDFDIEAAKQLLLHPKTTVQATERPAAIPLLPYLERMGVAAAPDLVELARGHEFCFVALGVGVSPGDGERLDYVDVSFDFSDARDVAVHNMIPETRRKVIATAGASGSLELDEALHLREPQVAASGRVRVGFDVSWTLARCDVVAIGTNTGCARWVLEDVSMFPGELKLGVVLRYPREHAKSITFTIRGGCRINRGLLWWRRQTPLLISSRSPIEIQLP